MKLPSSTPVARTGDDGGSGDWCAVKSVARNGDITAHCGTTYTNEMVFHHYNGDALESPPTLITYCGACLTALGYDAAMVS